MCKENGETDALSWPTLSSPIILALRQELFPNLVGLAKAQDNRFLMLWNGDWEGLYSTPSEATYALCRMLAYWTQRDVDRIDRIFRRSGLMREKWDESRAQSTWGRNTIINALRSPYIPSLVPRSDLEAQAHLPETDTGNRNRLVLRHGEDLRHCKQSDTWHIWDGMCWGEDITGAVVRAAIETAESMKDETNHMGDSDADARLRRYRFAMQAQNHGPLMNMISLAESALSVKISEFNRDTYDLVCLNGTLDLRTGNLRPSLREDLNSFASPVMYDESAKCPIWLEFLDLIFESRTDLIDYMQRALGYSLTGDVSERKKQTSSELLLTQRNMGGGPSNDLARLNGARIAVANETADNRRLDEAKVKALTGADVIMARFLHQEFFEFKPQFKLWLASNYKPAIMGTDDAIWDRIQLIPFDVRIPTVRPLDKHFGDKLREEYSGIFTWLVEGCLSWQRHGLPEVAAIQEANKEYRNTMDALGAFLEEAVEDNPLGKVSTQALFSFYLEWCSKSSEIPLSKRRLAVKLKERGWAEDRAGSLGWMHWLGHELRTMVEVL